MPLIPILLMWKPRLSLAVSNGSGIQTQVLEVFTHSLCRFSGSVNSFVLSPNITERLARPGPGISRECGGQCRGRSEMEQAQPIGITVTVQESPLGPGGGAPGWPCTPGGDRGREVQNICRGTFCCLPDGQETSCLTSISKWNFCGEKQLSNHEPS